MPNKSFTGDGNLKELQQNGADIPHLPFINLGNLSNYAVERFFEQELGEFTTPALGTIATNMGGQSRQGDDLYFVSQSPVDQGLAAMNVAAVSRMFVPEWASFEHFSGLGFPVPDFRDLTVAGLTITYSARTDTVVLANSEDYTQPDVDVAQNFDAAIGGSNTYTFKTSATIDVSDSAAAQLAALQAVDANFIGASHENYGLKIRHSNLASISESDFGLTNLGQTATYYEDGSQTIYIVPAVAQFNWDNHGFTDGQSLSVYYQTGDSPFEVSGLETKTITVVDADTFTVARGGATSERRYQQIDLGYTWGEGGVPRGTRPVTAKNVYQFYIPGVTAGVTTAADIPEFKVDSRRYRLLWHLAKRRLWIPVSSSGLTNVYPGVIQRVITYIRASDLFNG